MRYAAASTAAGSTAEPVTITSTGSPACCVRATSPSSRAKDGTGARGADSPPDRSTPSVKRSSSSASLLAPLIAVSAAAAWSGMGGGDVRARAGLDVDGRQAVGDDVVEVAGDAQPFLGHEPA